MFKFFNESINNYEVIPLNPLVINSPIDLIIGKPSLRKYNILQKVHTQSWESGITSAMRIPRICVRSSLSSVLVEDGEYEFVDQQHSSSKQLLAVLSEKSYVVDSDGVDINSDGDGPEFDWTSLLQ
jgi:hypothetical protein